MKKIIFALFLFACIFCCATVYADVIEVGEGEEFSSLTEAVAAASKGDEIVIHEGIFDESLETFPIVVDKTVQIRAAEGEKPVISCNGLTPTIKLSATDIVFSGISVEFIRSGVWVLDDNIAVTDCHFELSDLTWRETSCGTWVGGAHEMTLKGNNYVNCSIAVAGPPVTLETTGVPVLTAMFEVGEDVSFFDSHTIEDNYVNGKKLEYVIGLKDCTYNDECGQIIAVSCENVVFENIDVSCASIGMEMAYGKNLAINECTANDCGVFGIYICKCDDCTVTNTEADGSAHGIDLRDVDRCNVIDCVTCGCGQGVFFSWGRDSRVENCIVDNNGTGIFSATGGNNSVINCHVEGNELGFYIQHEPVYITGCEVLNNTTAGIRVTDCHPEITECSFEDNFVSALILSSTDGTVSSNTFEGSIENSIYIKNSENISLEENFMGDGEEEKVLISLSTVFGLTGGQNSQNDSDTAELTKIADHLYEINYTEDFDWGQEITPNDAGFACSGIQVGQYRGRNYDWYYADTDLCVIHAPKTDNREHSSVGITDLSFITDESGNYNIKKIPFLTVDGINDAGVCVQVNVIPYGENGEFTHTQDTSDDILDYHVVRYILDYADNVKEAIELLESKDIHNGIEDEEFHWMISGPADENDKTIKTVVVEVFPDGLHITEEFVGDIPIMTNFNISNFDGTAGSTGWGMGYERWQILLENYEQADSVMGTFDLMEKVFYSKVYDLYSDRFWYSEYALFDLSKYYEEAELKSLLGEETYNYFIENFGTVCYLPDLWDGDYSLAGDISKAGIISRVLETTSGYYIAQNMDNSLWITVETAVYDLENLTLDVAVRESQDHYHFEIEYEQN